MPSASDLASPSASAPATSAVPTQSQVSPLPAPAAALVKCEDFPQQTYTSETFRFSVGCPSNFSWQTYVPGLGRLFHSRTVDDKYLNGYPAGQVEISTLANSGNSLRDWIASHVGQPYSADMNHLWDSTSNLTDMQISGRPAIGFDYVYVGPEGPSVFHAAAFLLPQGSIFLMDWWTYSGDYTATIASVAQQMIASIQLSGA